MRRQALFRSRERLAPLRGPLQLRRYPEITRASRACCRRTSRKGIRERDQVQSSARRSISTCPRRTRRYREWTALSLIVRTTVQVTRKPGDLSAQRIQLLYAQRMQSEETFAIRRTPAGVWGSATRVATTAEG